LSVVHDNANASVFNGGDEPVYLFSAEYLFLFLLSLAPYERPSAEADQGVEGLKPIPSKDEVVSHDVRTLEALCSSAMSVGHVSYRQLEVVCSVKLEALVVQVFRDRS
jgi:hypothetical protein